jgi:hypothetical protein
MVRPSVRKKRAQKAEAADKEWQCGKAVAASQTETNFGFWRAPLWQHNSVLDTAGQTWDYAFLCDKLELLLVSSLYESTVRVFDVTTGTRLHDHAVSDLSFSLAHLCVCPDATRTRIKVLAVLTKHFSSGTVEEVVLNGDDPISTRVIVPYEVKEAGVDMLARVECSADIIAVMRNSAVEVLDMHSGAGRFIIPAPYFTDGRRLWLTDVRVTESTIVTALCSPRAHGKISGVQVFDCKTGVALIAPIVGPSLESCRMDSPHCTHQLNKYYSRYSFQCSSPDIKTVDGSCVVLSNSVVTTHPTQPHINWAAPRVRLLTNAFIVTQHDTMWTIHRNVALRFAWVAGVVTASASASFS